MLRTAKAAQQALLRRVPRTRQARGKVDDVVKPGRRVAQRRPARDTADEAAPAAEAGAGEGWREWSGGAGGEWAEEERWGGYTREEWAAWEAEQAQAQGEEGLQVYDGPGGWAEGAADAELVEPYTETALVGEDPDAELEEDDSEALLPDLPDFESGPGMGLLVLLRELREHWFSLKGSEPYPRQYEELITAIATAQRDGYTETIAPGAIEETLEDAFTLPVALADTVDHRYRSWYNASKRLLELETSQGVKVGRRRVLLERVPVLFAFEDPVEGGRLPFIYHPKIAWVLFRIFRNLSRTDGLALTDRSRQLLLRFVARHDFRGALNLLQQRDYQLLASEPYTYNTLMYQAASNLRLSQTRGLDITDFLSSPAMGMLFEGRTMLHANTLAALLGMLRHRRRVLHGSPQQAIDSTTRTAIVILDKALRNAQERMSLDEWGWALIIEAVLDFAGPRTAQRLMEMLLRKMEAAFGDLDRTPEMEGTHPPTHADEEWRTWPIFGETFDIEARYAIDPTRGSHRMARTRKLDLRPVMLPRARGSDLYHVHLKILSMCASERKGLHDLFHDYVAYRDTALPIRVKIHSHKNWWVHWKGLLPIEGTTALANHYVLYTDWEKIHGFLIKHIINKERSIDITLLEPMATKATAYFKNKAVQKNVVIEDLRREVDRAVADLLCVFVSDPMMEWGSTVLKTLGDIKAYLEGVRKLMHLSKYTGRAALTAELFHMLFDISGRSHRRLDRYVDESESPTVLMTPRDVEFVLKMCAEEGEWRAAEAVLWRVHNNMGIVGLGSGATKATSATAMARLNMHVLQSHLHDKVPHLDGRALRVIELTLQGLLQGAVSQYRTLYKTIELLADRAAVHGDEMLPVQYTREVKLRKGGSRMKFHPVGIDVYDIKIVPPRWIDIPSSTHYLPTRDDAVEANHQHLMALDPKRAPVASPNLAYQQKTLPISELAFEFVQYGTQRRKKLTDPLVLAMVRLWLTLGRTDGIINNMQPSVRKASEKQARFLDAVLEVCDRVDIATARDIVAPQKGVAGMVAATDLLRARLAALDGSATEAAEVKVSAA